MDIVFSKYNSILSKLIRFGTKSDSSHAAIRFGGDEANWMVHSTAHGVQPGWWNYFIRKAIVTHIFRINGIDENALEVAVDKCLDEVIGKSYDFKALIGLFITTIIRLVTGKEIKNFMGSSKTYFCSEFVLKVSKVIEKETGFKIYDGEFEETTPEDLLKQSYSNPYLEELK